MRTSKMLLGSVLLSLPLLTGPTIASSAAAAEIAPVAASAQVVAGQQGPVTHPQSAYSRGYKKGYRDGVRAGREACDEELQHATFKRSGPSSAYERGYRDGFNRGFQWAYERYCGYDD